MQQSAVQQAMNDLYEQYPFLDAVYAGLRFRSVPTHRKRDSYASEMVTIANMISTDGDLLYINDDYAELVYSTNSSLLRRTLLHTFLHLLLGHVTDPVFSEASADELDAEVEALIDAQVRRSMKAERLLGREEGRDDHSLWQTGTEKQRDDRRRKWELLGSFTGDGGGLLGGSRGRGSSPGTMTEQMSAVKKSRKDYRSFLTSMADWSEKAETDQDSFDYIYYNYGMEHYGNLPLIEPLEYREGYQLRELVIAIDTSGSCKKETVQRFLEETLSLLESSEHLFKEMKVLLIQCDCAIERETWITSALQWRQMCQSIEIIGRGGTDFRPVFDRIEVLKKEKKLRNVSGLVYFTDGDGIYPQEAPEYPTAVVFDRESEFLARVPKWAQVMICES